MMVEYIDREAAKMHFYDIDADIKRSKAKVGFSLVQVHEALDDIPAADVAPVVRCLECDKAASKDGRGAVYCRLFKMPMNEKGYCSLGEKADGE